MADETEKKDGAQDTPEQEKALPEPVFTGPSEDKRSESDPLVPVKDLLEQQRRDIQSMMDKRFDTERKRMESTGILGEYQQLLRDGFSEREAEQELRLRRMEQGSAPAEAVPGRTAQGGGQADSRFDLAGFLQEKGLDGNNADVLKVIQTPHKGPEDLKLDLLELKVSQLAASPSTSAAPALQQGDRLPDEDETDDQKRERIFGQSGNPLDLKRIRKAGGGVRIT